MIYAIVRQRPSPKRNRIHPDRQTIRGDSDWTSRVTLKILPVEATVYYQFHLDANKTCKVLQRRGSVRGLVLYRCRCLLRLMRVSF